MDMYSVELMVAEHDNILKLIQVVENACCKIIDGEEPVTEDFEKMIYFARNYADKHHHGKEEQVLFAEMTNNLGKIGTNLIQHGMLVEHDLGRLHISDLEDSIKLYRENPVTLHKLGMIAGASGYAVLLKRHIGKENEVIYPYAEKSLSKEILESVDERVRVFEEEATEQGVQEHCLGILKELTGKYGVE